MAEPSATASGLIAIVAVPITAFVTWWIAAKRIVIENITQERAKWREKVRERALPVHDPMIDRNGKDLDKHRNEFRALLNPFCDEDKDLVQCIRLPQLGDELSQAEEFATRIALLLKYDWELAKYEAKTIPFLQWKYPFFRCKPKRVLYRVYISGGDTKAEL